MQYADWRAATAVVICLYRHPYARQTPRFSRNSVQPHLLLVCNPAQYKGTTPNILAYVGCAEAPEDGYSHGQAPHKASSMLPGMHNTHSNTTKSMLSAATKQLPSQPLADTHAIQVTQHSVHAGIKHVLDACVRDVGQAYMHAANRTSRSTFLSTQVPASRDRQVSHCSHLDLTGKAEKNRGISKQADDMS